MDSNIGIVVPVGRFNPQLEQTLLSLIHQDVDVAIAIFDASNDQRTKDIIEKHRQHLSYVHYGKDGGQANAIALGWDKLGTSFVGWLNDDDHLAPGFLTTALELFTRYPDASVVFGPSAIIDEAGMFRGMHPAVQSTNIEDILRGNIISQPSCLIKYSHVKLIGGMRTDLHYTMDWDLWTRLFKKFPDSFIYNEDLLSGVTFSQNTKTASLSWRRVKELYSISRRYQSVFKALKTIFAFLKWGTIERFKSNSKQNFYPSKSKEYTFWDYDREIKGISLNGQLSGHDIEFIESNNAMRLSKNSNEKYEFEFIYPVGKGQLAKVKLGSTSVYDFLTFVFSID